MVLGGVYQGTLAVAGQIVERFDRRRLAEIVALADLAGFGIQEFQLPKCLLMIRTRTAEPAISSAPGSPRLASLSVVDTCVSCVTRGSP